MANLLVVFGATGNQGGSIISFVLDDPELSKQFRLRAITRDASSAKAQNLVSRGVEIVAADTNVASTLPAAMRGAHTVFIMTNPTFTPTGKADEIAQGKTLADAALAAGAQYVIFSTLPNVTKVSGGKYTGVWAFDAKAEIEEYIRSLKGLRSAFFAPGSFMQNFHGMLKVRANPHEPGTWIMARPMPPTAELPLVDITGDTGKFVGAILAEPEKYDGKVVCAATKLYSLEEMAAIISVKTGKKVTYVEVSKNEFRGGAPPAMADTLAQMMAYQADFGYYGPKTEELVKWAAENARGKVNAFEDYLEMHPLELK